MNRVLKSFSVVIATVVPLLSCIYASADSAKRALVIIDMQESVLKEWKKTNDVQKKKSALIKKQKQLIDEAKRNGIPILVVQWEGKGPTTSALLNRLGTTKTIIEKDKNGLFDGKSASHAEELLKNRGITDLFIVGIDGGACVEDTIRGTLKNNYKVFAVNDGIAEHSSRAERCKQGGAIYPYSFRAWADDFKPRACGIPFDPPATPKLRLVPNSGHSELPTSGVNFYLSNPFQIPLEFSCLKPSVVALRCNSVATARSFSEHAPDLERHARLSIPLLSAS